MALDFTQNSTDKVDCGSASTIDDLNPFSLAFWYYGDQTGTTRAFFSKAAGASERYGLFNTSDRFQLRVLRGTGNDNYLTPNNTITDGVWQFLVATYNSANSAGNRIKFYRGTLTALVAEVTPDSTTDGSGGVDTDAAQSFEIGNLTGAGNFGAGGKIARFAYIAAELTLADCVRLQFADLATWGQFDCRILMELGFDGTGTQTDFSGNGNAGTVTGATQSAHMPIPSYTIVGHAPYVIAAAYTLPAAAGSLNLSGPATGLTVARTLAAATGSLSLTGPATGLTVARTLAAAAGSLSLTGPNVGLTVARSIIAATGTLSLTGPAAGLTVARTLVAGAGTLSLSGQAADLIFAYALTAAAGSFTLSGSAAGLTAARTLPSESGSFTLSGSAAGLNVGYSITAASGSLTFAGQSAGLLSAFVVAAAAGSFTFSGSAASFSYSAGVVQAYTVSLNAQPSPVVSLKAQASPTVILNAQPSPSEELKTG